MERTYKVTPVPLQPRELPYRLILIKADKNLPFEIVVGLLRICGSAESYPIDGIWYEAYLCRTKEVLEAAEKHLAGCLQGSCRRFNPYSSNPIRKD